MPVLDSCHHQISRALRRDGWTIADKPKYIGDAETEIFVYIDIEAFRDPNGSPLETRTIYVEVKCFPRKNVTQEIYIALGQYLIYRALLEKQAIAVPLFLAVPQPIYEATFNTVFRKALHDSGIMMIVVDLETETIVQWIK
ncbi:MAG: hypothetical protein KF716_19980 [Anaerolineae bacterium]|nr:hypothetical protein [Anaerolineae bacterium]